MLLLVSLLLSVILLSHSTGVAAQYQDLLKPIPQTELSIAREKNEYLLNRILCHAKRYRLVSVDVDALLSDQPIEIDLFDDVSIIVHPTSIDHLNRGVIIWYGMPEQIPRFGPNPYLSGTALKRAREMHEESYEVSIAASVSTTDLETNANYWRLSPGGPASDSDFYGVSASFRSLDRSKGYRIDRVDMGGPYHVLYENDPSKGVMPGSADRYPKRERMRRVYRDCIESLGPDPSRDALLEVERRNRK